MNLLSLGEASQRLVRVMQEMRFGHVERLRIEDGEPVWNPPPEIVRTVLLGQPNIPTDLPLQDFELKKQHKELFRRLNSAESLEIERLEVQDGLPFRLTIREQIGP